MLNNALVTVYIHVFDYNYNMDAGLPIRLKKVNIGPILFLPRMLGANVRLFIDSNERCNTVNTP